MYSYIVHYINTILSYHIKINIRKWKQRRTTQHRRKLLWEKILHMWCQWSDRQNGFFPHFLSTKNKQTKTIIKPSSTLYPSIKYAFAQWRFLRGDERTKTSVSNLDTFLRKIVVFSVKLSRVFTREEFILKKTQLHIVLSVS